jgi:hypothetical protein
MESSLHLTRGDSPLLRDPLPKGCRALAVSVRHPRVPVRSTYSLSFAQPRAQSCRSVPITLKLTQFATITGSRGAAKRSRSRVSSWLSPGAAPMYSEGCTTSFCGSCGIASNVNVCCCGSGLIGSGLWRDGWFAGQHVQQGPGVCPAHPGLSWLIAVTGPGSW